jgi:putative membrane protein insertion efficiency factor
VKKVANIPALFLLKFYKYGISPFLPSVCRFEPTCSNYAIQCFQTHSFFKALFFTAKRLFRCHPLCEGGFDPAPEASAANGRRVNLN